MTKLFSTIFFLIIATQTKAQTLGGNAVFNFLNLPNTAQLSALGGVNVSAITNDVGMSFQNASLLRKEMHGQANASFNAFFAGIRNYSLQSGYHLENAETNVAVGVNFFDYGNIARTDAAGNVSGTFHPTDFVLQLQGSRQYKDRWFYGASLKFIQSSYSEYKSNGLAVDIGVSYLDSSNGLQASMVAKNMGGQLKSYDQSIKEELPFDLQAGISKKLAKAPIQFSLTAHHLHRFDLRYNDTAFLSSEGATGFDRKLTVEKLLSHLVLASQVYVGDKVEVSVGYNFLRRKDLNAFNASNGLNGVSFGAGLILKKLQLRYATGFYQQNMFNHFAINFWWN